MGCVCMGVEGEHISALGMFANTFVCFSVCFISSLAWDTQLINQLIICSSLTFREMV